MTDTTSPSLTWGEAFRGLLPSLNTALVAIVTACLSIGGTILTTRMTAKPVEPPKTVTVTVEKIVEKPVDLSALDQRIAAVIREELGKAAGPGVNRRKKTAPLK